MANTAALVSEHIRLHQLFLYTPLHRLKSWTLKLENSGITPSGKENLFPGLLPLTPVPDPFSHPGSQVWLQ